MKTFTVNVSCVDGSWKPLPIRDVRCVLVTCDILEDPVIEEGVMKFNRSHLPKQPRYKATVTMECPAGQFFRPLRSRRFTTMWVVQIWHHLCNVVQLSVIPYLSVLNKVVKLMEDGVLVHMDLNASQHLAHSISKIRMQFGLNQLTHLWDQLLK